MYEESGSDVDYIEDSLKGENKKNSKEDNYTNINEKKEGRQADLLKSKITRYHHDIPRKKAENEKALVMKEMELLHLGKNIFIGDSAATSHMTSNKIGVYKLVPINGLVMIGNGKSISCTHKGKLDVICKHKDGSIARETCDVKIVPELNHDLFSFTEAMKNGWQMNGRWKEGGLMIELFKIKRDGTYRARLVALGYSQIPGVDYTDNFAPVAHDVNFRVALARMMVEKLDSLVMDVETAFLYGDIEEEIFMKSRLGLEEIDPGSSPEDCYQLKKGIYGLCQAARQFWKKFVDTIKKESFGFTVSPADPCMLFKENELGICIIIMYVDDMLIIGKKEQVQDFASKIQKEFSVEIKYNLADYLSCEFHMNKERTRGWLGQPSIIKSLEQKFG